MLRKIKPILLCLASAVFLALPFNNAKFWVFSWFGFVPAFFALNNKTARDAFLLFLITGLAFWWIVIYWLVNITFAGTALLILYLSLYFALFGLLIRGCTRKTTPYALFFIPSVWVLLEFARSHLLTGFPWALLGYSQCPNLIVLQVADITGAWGVSFLLIFANTAIVEIIWSAKERLWPRFRITVALLSVLISLALCYGHLRLSCPLPAGERFFRISVIQGNIPQELKWAPGAGGYILDQYSYLTQEAAKGSPDLVIWPEAASPALLGEDAAGFSRIFALGRKIATPILLGAVVKQGEDYFNSAILLDSRGEIAGRYDKLHLVPFGEYIPLKEFLPFLETVVPIGDILPGKEYTVMEIQNPKSQIPNKFGVLICFEDLFPELSRKFIKGGAEFLVNITNDAWYKRTSAPYQHLQASVFRAVENRTYLARSANTGISGFISPQGRVISTVRDASSREIFVPGYDTLQIAMKKRQPGFYTRYGDLFIILCILLFLCGIIRFPKLYKPCAKG